MEIVAFILLLIWWYYAYKTGKLKSIKELRATKNQDIPIQSESNISFTVSLADAHMSTEDFSGKFENGRITKKLKESPKNLLLKRLVDGEKIICKCTPWSSWTQCVMSAENDRAVGMIVRYDSNEKILLESVFDVKITAGNTGKTLKISREGYTDTYRLKDFSKDIEVGIDYFQDSNYDIYKRENVRVLLT